MQSQSLENKQFLQDYHSVLSHHVNCILNSRMLLDEDMHLVLTFWNPNVEKSKYLSNMLTSSAYATVGLLVSVRLKNAYPLILAAVPIAVQLSQSMKICYFKRKYKLNFEKLLSLIFELYELNRKVLDYYYKKDMAAQACKMPNEAYTILSKPGEEFLKFTTLLIMGILDKIRDTMLQISELVPLSEGHYIYALEWNLEQFKKLDLNDFKEIQHQFQKLCDLYVLIVSNFLSCLGLSFCVQLWKESSCHFKNIFDNLIPELICSLETSLNNIKQHFNRIRFTLLPADSFRKQEKFKSGKNLVQLQQPLADFMTNVQVTFETAKQLQLLTDQCNSNVEFENFYPFVENMRSQFAVCDASLNTFLKVFCLLTKQTEIKKTDTIPLAVANSESKISAEIRFDDPLEVLEDEEYNLSIHGSEDGDSGPPLYDHVDNCSTEHLELMLYELKRKLKERKGGQDQGKDKTPDEEKKTKDFNESSDLNQHQLGTDKNSTIKQHAPPIPPPMPLLSRNGFSSMPASSMVVDQLPTVDNIHIGLLDAVKTVAQQLNRDEEVFGCDADISDSDEL